MKAVYLPKMGLGKNQVHALAFAVRHGIRWHSYATNRATIAAIRGLVTVNEWNQFMPTLAGIAYARHEPIFVNE